jgi:hypothetical protein
LDIRGTASSGYDSITVTALVKQYGCQEVIASISPLTIPNVLTQGIKEAGIPRDVFGLHNRAASVLL